MFAYHLDILVLIITVGESRCKKCDTCLKYRLFFCTSSMTHKHPKYAGIVFRVAAFKSLRQRGDMV